MSDDVAKLGITIDSSDAVTAVTNLDSLTNASKAVEDGVSKLTAVFDKNQKVVDDLSRTVKQLDIVLNNSANSSRKSNQETEKLGWSISNAADQTKKFNAESTRTNSISGNLAGNIAKIAATYISLQSAINLVKEITDTTVAMERFQAQLVTGTGSTENAAAAFDAIKDLAKTTPYDLGQVTDAFNKLVSYGLNPSERAIIAYGNTSSAMGKSLTQMIEAVADASTGEFERLKEFGIRAKKEGDNVSFTFRGVTTTVKNSSAEIQDYLIGLSETNFGGEMQRQMETLGGYISNFEDAWTLLIYQISQEGVGDVIKDSVKSGIQAVEELTAMLQSGQLEAYFNANVQRFAKYADDISAVFNYFNDEIKASEFAATETADFIVDAFADLPENIRAMIQILTIEFASGFDKISLHATAIKERLKAIFTDDTFEAVDQRLYASIDGVNKVRAESIAVILKERDAALASYDAQIAKADEARKKFDEANANKTTGNYLGQFQVNSEQPGAASTVAKTSNDSKTKLQKLINDLATEEEVIRNSFVVRQNALKEFLLSNDLTQSEYNNLTLANLTEHNKKLSDLEKQRFDEKYKNIQSDLNNIAINSLSELEQEKLSYASKLAVLQNAREANITTIMSYDELERTLAEQHQKNLSDIEKKGMDDRSKFLSLSYKEQAKQQLGTLLQFTASAAQHDKKMFEANKIAGIANAFISTQEGASAALEWGWPLGPIFAGIIIAAGMRNIQAMKSMQFGSSASAPSSVPYSGGPATNPVNYNQNASNLVNQTPVQSGPVFNIYGDISGNDAEKLFEQFRVLISERDYVNYFNAA